MPDCSSAARWVSPQVLQCVAFLGTLSGVVVITSSTRRSLMDLGASTRGSSYRASRQPRLKRSRQKPTVQFVVRSCLATSLSVAPLRSPRYPGPKPQTAGTALSLPQSFQSFTPALAQQHFRASHAGLHSREEEAGMVTASCSMASRLFISTPSRAAAQPILARGTQTWRQPWKTTRPRYKAWAVQMTQRCSNLGIFEGKHA